MLLRAVLFVVMFGPSFTAGYFLPSWFKVAGVNIQDPITTSNTKLNLVILLPILLAITQWAVIIMWALNGFAPELLLPQAILALELSLSFYASGMMFRTRFLPWFVRLIHKADEWLYIKFP